MTILGVHTGNWIHWTLDHLIIQITTQYTSMHYHFVIYYITLACWPCHHMYVARFWVLIMGNLLFHWVR
jgi:hypothetical protein